MSGQCGKKFLSGDTKIAEISRLSEVVSDFDTKCSGKKYMEQLTFLVFGATGQTGQHFISIALKKGHKVKALVRDLKKIALAHENLELQQGSILDYKNFDELVSGADFVVSMLGDVTAQRHETINLSFVQKLIPSMRRKGVKRFLYQAGALSKPPEAQLPFILWLIRNTIARGYDGQHKDNEAVMKYLTNNADDIDWIVHRAGIGSNGLSKGILNRSASKFSIGTFYDCALYSYRLAYDESAVHTCDYSTYS